MTPRPRLSRSDPISACEGLLAFEPLLVPLDADVAEVLRRAARQPTTRLVGVVDEDGRLVGVIPMRELIETVVARTIPEAMMIDIVDTESVAHFGHVVASRTAAQAMLPPAAVTADASVVAAFREMHRRRLSGVYVVDRDGRPTDYVDGLELAYLAAVGDPDEPAPDDEAPRADAHDEAPAADADEPAPDDEAPTADADEPAPDDEAPTADADEPAPG